jgi:chromosome segregation ATPase
MFLDFSVAFETLFEKCFDSFEADNLRKKLVIMTKLQHKFAKATANTGLSSELHDYFYERENNNNGFLNPLYKETVDDMLKANAKLQNEYNQLNTRLSSKDSEIDQLKRCLAEREDKIDELNLQLSKDINLNAELMKSQNRDYRNVIQINKDLEMKILALNSDLAKLKNRQIVP